MSSARTPSSRTRTRTRSSVSHCKERYCCSGVKVVAVYYCPDCLTKQCEECERELHKLTRYSSHRRVWLEQPLADTLCQQLPSCAERNLADVVCEACERRYCFDCDSKTHVGLKRQHKRVAFVQKTEPVVSPTVVSPLVNQSSSPISTHNTPAQLDSFTTGDFYEVSNTVDELPRRVDRDNLAFGQENTGVDVKNVEVVYRNTVNRDTIVAGRGCSGATSTTSSEKNTVSDGIISSINSSNKTLNSNTALNRQLNNADSGLNSTDKLKNNDTNLSTNSNLNANVNSNKVSDCGKPIESSSASKTESFKSSGASKHPPVAVVSASVAHPPESGHQQPGALNLLTDISLDESPSLYEVPSDGRSVGSSRTRLSSHEDSSGDFSFHSLAPLSSVLTGGQSADTMSGIPSNQLNSSSSGVSHMGISPIGISPTSSATIETTKSDRRSAGRDSVGRETSPRGPESPVSPSEGFVGWSGSLEGTTRKNSAMVKPTSSREVETVQRMMQSSMIINREFSFELANQHEELLVRDEEEFIDKLGCDPNAACKVISIFGNTGDGKSHTLNHTFFEGREVFRTSPMQTSCTIGVWCVYDAVHRAILLDTEGLLGVTANHNQRTRLLLKVLAISDIVIYRTRSERLHSDLFQFLGDASDAYLKHFQIELNRASQRMNLDSSVSSLCPVVVIFHETQHTEIVTKGASEPAEQFLRERFKEMGLNCKAFSAIQYVGTRTANPPTDFKDLLIAANKHLRNNEVRCPRKPGVIFKSLQLLNEKFSGPIDRELPHIFPDQYFTCRISCLACGARCCCTLNHLKDDRPHEAHKDSQCVLQAQYDNGVYTCKACFNRGKTVVVVPKTCASNENSWFSLASYAWSGYVLECSNCGVIYRSRQHWYGNVDPEKSAVRMEIRHVWPDHPSTAATASKHSSNTVLMGTHNAARRVFDGLNYVTETIAGVGAKPAKYVSNWVTDQIAPPYWRPNSEITECRKCKQKFTEVLAIHHCRKCGEGFCDLCSSKRKPVPERNWGMEPVRVCDGCYENNAPEQTRAGGGDGVQKVGDESGDPNQLVPRKVGEAIGSTVGVLATVINYPYAALRDAARPTYWVADEKITACIVCGETFGPKLALHHCRGCGEGVCDGCSPTPRPVPSRGWDYPVRVCKTCFKKPEL